MPWLSEFSLLFFFLNLPSEERKRNFVSGRTKRFVPVTCSGSFGIKLKSVHTSGVKKKPKQCYLGSKDCRPELHEVIIILSSTDSVRVPTVVERKDRKCGIAIKNTGIVDF